jgi:hypothetical protein
MTARAPLPTDVTAAALPAAWRERAEGLERYVPAVATAFRDAAQELEAALRSEADKLLTLQEAAAASGMHADHVRHLVRDGRLHNYGRKGAPRVRAGDLPRKPARRTPTTYDVAADALSLVRRTAS